MSPVRLEGTPKRLRFPSVLVTFELDDPEYWIAINEVEDEDIRSALFTVGRIDASAPRRFTCSKPDAEILRALFVKQVGIRSQNGDELGEAACRRAMAAITAALQ
jgi:hypothetical protein